MRHALCLGVCGLHLARLCVAQDAAAVPPAAAPDHSVIVRARALIDGTSAQSRQDQEILIRGDRIVAVYNAGTRPAPQGAQIIDLGAATVLPGLIDSHTHIFLQGEVPAAGGYDIQLLKFPASYRAARAVVAARRALEQGFTTIRDVETEGAGYGDVGIKQAINEGYIPGPRMFVATRSISTTGGYPLEGYAPEIVVPKGVQLIDGPVEARKAAREQLDHGADWIKVYMTHRSWVDEQGALVSQPTLTVEELRAIVDEAHGWRKKVACHAYNGVGPAAGARRRLRLHRAWTGAHRRADRTDGEAGHLVRADARCLLLRSGSARHPDRQARPQACGGPRRLVQESTRRRGQDRLRHRRRWLLWSDPIAQEFARMVEFGMTPMQAIQSATSRAADLLGERGDGYRCAGRLCRSGRRARGPSGGRQRTQGSRVRYEGRCRIPFTAAEFSAALSVLLGSNKVSGPFNSGELGMAPLGANWHFGGP